MSAVGDWMLSRHVAVPTGTSGPTASTSPHSAPIAARIGFRNRCWPRRIARSEARNTMSPIAPTETISHQPTSRVTVRVKASPERAGDRLGRADGRFDETDRQAGPTDQRESGATGEADRPPDPEACEQAADHHDRGADHAAGSEVAGDVVERRRAGRDSGRRSCRADVDDVTDGGHQRGDATEERSDEDELDPERLARGGNVTTSSWPSNSAGISAVARSERERSAAAGVATGVGGRRDERGRRVTAR